tara:strand:+ start:1128 stop:1766 length:639 start_codon:yes stop_codon:yes gene_type:complete
MTPAEQIEELRSKVGALVRVRFEAARRVRFNYILGKLTVVILSLWAIFISYALTSDIGSVLSFDVEYVKAAGIMLPVFVVIFSLIEGGENLLHAHALDQNARRLRELYYKIEGAILSASANNIDLIAAYEKYSHEYNNVLERSPVNHGTVDYESDKYGKYGSDRLNATRWSGEWIYLILMSAYLWFRRQAQRVLYMLLWFVPVLLFDFGAVS